jgi:hypothetical protein
MTHLRAGIKRPNGELETVQNIAATHIYLDELLACIADYLKQQSETNRMHGSCRDAFEGLRSLYLQFGYPDVQVDINDRKITGVR